MCPLQVPKLFLKEWAIVQAESTLSGAMLPPGVIPAVIVQTFSLQHRDKAGPTAYEHLAVQQACHQLLTNVSFACIFAYLLVRPVRGCKRVMI